jgi:predicted kinase
MSKIMLDFPTPSSIWDNFGLMMPTGSHVRFKTEQMNPTVIILSGIPTSGKSTWAKMYQNINYMAGDDFRSYRIVSRDKIREQCFPQPYIINKDNENKVTGIYNEMIENCMKAKVPMILDNTHCKEQYLKEALKKFEGTDYRVKMKFFDIPLWKAYYRNIIRNWRTGKWIPIKVIESMKKNYDKINKKNYERYIF